MEHKTLKVFSKKETELARLLEETGMKRTFAITLVYLAHVPDTTMHDIERGTDLRQPEVSMAVRYLVEKGWVRDEIIPSIGKGRPVKRLNLAVPFTAILESVAEETRKTVDNQLHLIGRIRKDVAGMAG